ncbi:MAG: hypothetical protein HY577_02210 [Candidatus Nealsonbacteria bacterium]|nr:hypothetical protein [Candidatus Nealsonbacteria bacterium]
MEEKLAFLKRAEIRTMAKDLARLQETQALQEKERISQLRIDERLKKEATAREKIASTMIPKAPATEEIIPRPPSPKREPGESLLPQARKPSALEKVLVRLLLVLLSLGFFLVATFGYWFFFIKKKGVQPSVSPSPSSSPVASVTPPSEPPPIENGVPPTPILEVKEIKILRLTPEKSLKLLLSESLINVLPSGANPEFFELAPLKDGHFLNFSETLAELDVKVPVGFSEMVSEKDADFDLFLYAKGAGEQRLGFVVKSKDPSGAAAMLRGWEKTMEGDWAEPLRIVGKEKESLTTAFRQSNYGGIFFRYLSSQEKNLGISWSILGDNLIITFSGESIMKTIDLLR